MTGRVLLLCLLLAGAGARAQVRIDGMAGAGSALIDGIDAAGVNPARLADPGGPRMRLFDSFGAVSNNSFGLSDYRRYNGAALSEADEERILSAIDGDHLEADGIVRAAGPAIRRGGWAVGIRTAGEAGLGLPKEALRLLFDGNRPEEAFDFGRARGSGGIASALAISHGRWIDVPVGGRVAVGATIRWIHGWAHARILDSSGSISTEREGLRGEGTMRLRTATGGNGFGFDLAAWRPVGEGWAIAVAVQDLFSTVRWTRASKVTTAWFRVRESTAEDLGQGEDLVESDVSTVPAPSFRTAIPPRLSVGVAREFGRWTFAADWLQGFERSPAAATTTPRLAAGAQARLGRGIAGRAGFSIGGVDRRSAALGIGYAPGPLRIDLAVAARDGSFPFTGNGIGAGLALGASF